MTITSKLITSFKKVPTIGKISFYLAVALLISFIIFRFAPVKEGLTQNKNYILMEGPKVFDNFYVNIYDALLYDEVKNDYEIGEIINKSSPTEESIIVDIGSGTGHHVGKLQKDGHNVIGYDISKYMVDKASSNYPNATFKVGDGLDSSIIDNESVTHVLCLYFTIYYMKNKKQFFENVFNWLMPGGYFILHLVNKDKFDPVLPAGNPFEMVSPQEYAKHRITETKIKFKGYEYTGNYEVFPNDIARYKEIFKDDKTNKIRENSHIMYMDTQKKILNQAQDIGFIINSQIDLMNIGYDYHYLYILQKPN